MEHALLERLLFPDFEQVHQRIDCLSGNIQPHLRTMRQTINIKPRSAVTVKNRFVIPIASIFVELGLDSIIPESFKISSKRDCRELIHNSKVIQVCLEPILGGEANSYRKHLY